MKEKKPFYKRWWVWVLAIFILAIGANLGSEEDQRPAPKQEEEAVATEQTESDSKPPTEVEEQESNVPKEHVAALKKAESYAKRSNMSKEAIRHQLTSEYGEGFSEEAAT